ncbi:hypothetical protein DCS_04594 [Drechmeria coniospora]|uniref:Uncharacterized protein n=1 Tax=Drechmeria coniospora TaxID=98403 RepID=A0A151GKE0_DRECN|nr:hypothetical protein DCS_04594 [Drechmeria coniospora]KYK57583.1 hypothetical protein DCS_04594 [Drechmeria coniospora]
MEFIFFLVTALFIATICVVTTLRTEQYFPPEPVGQKASYRKYKGKISFRMQGNTNNSMNAYVPGKLGNGNSTRHRRGRRSTTFLTTNISDDDEIPSTSLPLLFDHPEEKWQMHSEISNTLIGSIVKAHAKISDVLAKPCPAWENSSKRWEKLQQEFTSNQGADVLRTEYLEVKSLDSMMIGSIISGLEAKPLTNTKAHKAMHDAAEALRSHCSVLKSWNEAVYTEVLSTLVSTVFLAGVIMDTSGEEAPEYLNDIPWKTVRKMYEVGNMGTRGAYIKWNEDETASQSCGCPAAEAESVQDLRTRGEVS